MHSESRKAQHNSFAHHRAALLFPKHLAEMGEPTEWSASLHEGTDLADGLDSFRRRVSAGIRGFVPAIAAVAS